MKSRFALLVGVLVIASMLLTACPAPTPQVVEKVVTQIVEQKVEVVQTQIVEKEKVVEKIVAATAAPEAKPFVTWIQYDQGNVDPKSDERVGNEYLRQAIPQFNKAFEGKWVWDNQFTPWDRAQQPSLSRQSRPVPRCPISWTFRQSRRQLLLQERHGAGPDRVGEGAALVRRDGRQRAEDVHRPRRQALLHPHGHPAVVGLTSGRIASPTASPRPLMRCSRTARR